jgi:hypothetical protein
MRNLSQPYSSDRLTGLLERIEDWLLTVRKIRIPEEQMKEIHKALLSRLYSPAQMSVASIWIKFGKWAISKKDLELSDFYPTKDQISHLESEMVSKEYHYKKIQALKTEHEIEISKLRYEIQENRLNENEIQAFFTGTQRIKDLHDEIERLRTECKRLIQKNTLLEYSNQEKKALIEELENQIKSKKIE